MEQPKDIMLMVNNERYTLIIQVSAQQRKACATDDHSAHCTNAMSAYRSHE